MGLYDTLTWHTDLPELHEGLNAWMIGFQTKSLPNSRQRVMEVTHEGRLQLREYIGEGYDSSAFSEAMISRTMKRRQATMERRLAGKTLDPTDYSKQMFYHTGEITFYGNYGVPANGQLTFQAMFQDGRLQSVLLVKNKEPDQFEWDAYQSKTKGMKQFLVTPLPNKPQETGDD